MAGLAAALRAARWPWGLNRPTSGRTPPRPMAALPLHGPGLPALALAPGRPVAVVVPHEAIAAQLADALAAEGLAQGPVCALCTDHAEPWTLAPRHLDAWRAGTLRVLAWQAAGLAGWTRAWTPPVWRELGQLGLGPDDMVIMQPWPALAAALAAQPVDAAVAARAVRWLRRWAQPHAGAMVLVLVGERAAAVALADAGMPEVLHLGGAPQGLWLERLAPASRAADDAAARVAVSVGVPAGPTLPGQATTVAAAPLGPAQPGRVPDGTLRVVTTAGVVAGQAGVPASWTVLPGLDALAAAAADAAIQGAVLPYDGPACLPRLAECIQALRHLRPQGLKIVVRELAGKLRFPQELALLRLGAVSVVYQEIGFSRLVQQVETLPERLTLPAAAPDAGEVLEAVTPDAPHGYLPLSEFCTTVARLLERTSALSLAHCLVQLPLLPDVPHLDALTACQLTRAGDLVTTEGDNLWLFLFGCREPDVMPTLGRVFSLPPSVLFAHVAVDADAQSMQRALQGLSEAAAQAPADFSAVLAAQAQPAVAGWDTPAAAPAPVAAATDSLHWLPLQREPRALTDAAPVLPRPRSLRAHPLALRSATPA